MKKKILALVCAMTMVCAMGLSVAAEESVTAGDVAGAVAGETGNTGSIAVSDDVVTFDVAGITATLPVSAANREASAAAADAIIANDDVTVSAVDGGDVAAIAKMAVAIADKATDAKYIDTLFCADITAAAGTTVTLNKAIGADQKAFALHYTNGGVEVVECEVSAGKISFTLSSFSPVSVIVVTYDTQADSTADAPAQAPAVEATSPKTGSVAAAFALLALVSGCGAAVLGKKEN